jgi:hypothetical protein
MNSATYNRTAVLRSGAFQSASSITPNAAADHAASFAGEPQPAEILVQPALTRPEALPAERD